MTSISTRHQYLVSASKSEGQHTVREHPRRTVTVLVRIDMKAPEYGMDSGWSKKHLVFVGIYNNSKLDLLINQAHCSSMFSDINYASRS